MFADTDAESDGHGVAAVGHVMQANNASELLGVNSGGGFVIGEHDGDVHAALIGIENGVEKNAVARNVDGGGDFVGATGGDMNAAHADGRGNQGAALATAVGWSFGFYGFRGGGKSGCGGSGSFVCDEICSRAGGRGRGLGNGAVVRGDLFGDELFGGGVHFRDGVFARDGAFDDLFRFGWRANGIEIES